MTDVTRDFCLDDNNLFQSSKAVKSKNITLSSMTCLFRSDVIVTKELVQNLLGNPDDKFLLVIFVLLVHKVVFQPLLALLTAGINSYKGHSVNPYTISCSSTALLGSLLCSAVHVYRRVEVSKVIPMNKW